MSQSNESQLTEVFLAALKKISGLIQQDRLQEALETSSKLIDLLPQDTTNLAYPLAYRGQIYGRLGNIPAALADLKRSVELKPTAEGYYNYALAHLHANDKTSGLEALLRVTQLEPTDKEAMALRKALAKELGLEDLEVIAGTVEQFCYSQCGAGTKWKVELRKMYRFHPDGTHEEYNAVVLDLCQQPNALVQIRSTPPHYIIIVNYEQEFLETSQHAFAEAVTKEIPANQGALTELFNAFLKDSVLIQENNQLLFREAA